MAKPMAHAHFWWAQPPGGALRGEWERHLLTTQGSTNSLDIGDLERTGATSILTGEHAGRRRIAIWRNDGRGVFDRIEVDAGYESHLGVRLHDMRRAGALDIISIG